MVIDPETIKIKSEAWTARMRTMTGAQRVEMGLQMYTIARTAIGTKLRATHPQWDEKQIGTEVRRIMDGPWSPQDFGITDNDDFVKYD